MAIEVQIVETINEEKEHTEALLDQLVDGWEIMAHQVILYDHDAGDVLYTTLLKREDQKHRVDVSSLRDALEVVEQRQKRILQRVKILEDNVADQDDFAPVNYHFVPVSAIDIATTRNEIVEAAILEDLEAGR